MNLIQAICLYSGLILTGVIWVIQLVHYPGFQFLENKAQTYYILHQRRITYIVLPLMMMEMLSSLFLAYFDHQFIPLILVLPIWLSTIFLQIPLHQKLLSQNNHQLIKQLVQTNWIRTSLWSLKTIYLIGIQFLA